MTIHIHTRDCAVARKGLVKARGKWRFLVLSIDLKSDFTATVIIANITMISQTSSCPLSLQLSFHALGGGIQLMFIRGGSAPRTNHSPFYIPFFTKKVPLFVYLPLTMVPLSHTLFRTLHISFNWCKCTVF